MTAAVIARPHGQSWTGCYVRNDGAPTALGLTLHHLARVAYAADRRTGIAALTRKLTDDHSDWWRIDPDGNSLGQCLCHDPQPIGPSWPGGQIMTPGQSNRARFAYILTPTALQIEVRIDGNWRRLGRAAHSLLAAADRFEQMTRQARLLNDARASADPLT